MSEKEKAIVEKLKDTIPKMSEYQKGYLLGMVESMADRERSEPNKENRERSSRWTRKKAYFRNPLSADRVAGRGKQENK